MPHTQEAADVVIGSHCSRLPIHEALEVGLSVGIIVGFKMYHFKACDYIAICFHLGMNLVFISEKFNSSNSQNICPSTLLCTFM